MQNLCVNVYYAAVLIGRIIDLARPLRLSARPSLVRAFTSRNKRCTETEIGINISYNRSDRSANNFQLKKLKVRRTVTQLCRQCADNNGNT